MNPLKLIKVNDKTTYYPLGGGDFPFMGAVADDSSNIRVQIEADQEYEKISQEIKFLDETIRNNEVIRNELESNPNSSINLKLYEKIYDNGNIHYSFEDKTLRFKLNININ